MPDEPLQVLLAKQERYAVASLYTEQRLVWPDLYHGEVALMAVSQMLRAPGAPNNRLWKFEDISDYTVKVALGVIDALPLAGSWTWEFGADSIILSYDETESSYQTKINAGADMIAAGGLTVRQEGKVFVFTFNELGAQSEITALFDKLSPPSVVDFGVIQDGDADHAMIGTFQLIQRPVSLNTLEDDLSDVVEVSFVNVSIGGTGVNHKCRLTIAGRPYGGSVALNIDGNITDSIPIEATEAEFKAYVGALPNVASPDNVSVLKENDLQWLFTFIKDKAETAMGSVEADGVGLLYRLGKMGDVDLRSANLQLLFKGARTVDAFIEFELTPPGGFPRKYQQSIRFINSLIDPSTVGPVPQGDFYTKVETDALINGKQDADDVLTSLSELATGSNKGIYAWDVDTLAEYDLTAFGRTLSGAGDAAAARASLEIPSGLEAVLNSMRYGVNRYILGSGTSNSAATGAGGVNVSPIGNGLYLGGISATAGDYAQGMVFGLGVAGPGSSYVQRFETAWAVQVSGYASPLASADVVYAFLVGASNGNLGDPSAEIGFRILDNDTVQLCIHDGMTLFTSNVTISGMLANEACRFNAVMTWDGIDTLKLWLGYANVNGVAVPFPVLVGTLTASGGPITGNMSNGGFRAGIFALNNASYGSTPLLGLIQYSCMTLP